MMPDDFSLRDLAEPPEASYEAVRGRVLGEIRRQRRVRKAVRTVAAVAACLTIGVGILLWPREAVLVSRPPMLARAPKPPELKAGTSILPSRYHRKRSAPARELVVRMQTDDPNVVIIWMVD